MNQVKWTKIAVGVYQALDGLLKLEQERWTDTGLNWSLTTESATGYFRTKSDATWFVNDLLAGGSTTHGGGRDE